MTGIEPRTSGVGSNCFTNWPTSTALVVPFTDTLIDSDKNSAANIGLKINLFWSSFETEIRDLILSIKMVLSYVNQFSLFESQNIYLATVT